MDEEAYSKSESINPRASTAALNRNNFCLLLFPGVWKFLSIPSKSSSRFFNACCPSNKFNLNECSPMDRMQLVQVCEAFEQNLDAKEKDYGRRITRAKKIVSFSKDFERSLTAFLYYP